LAPCSAPHGRAKANAAAKLADAVAPKTAAEQFREDLVHQADKTIGKVIITSAGLAEIRHPSDPEPLNGASLAMVRAARRAAKRGDAGNAASSSATTGSAAAVAASLRSRARSTSITSVLRQR